MTTISDHDRAEVQAMFKAFVEAFHGLGAPAPLSDSSVRRWLAFRDHMLAAHECPTVPVWRPTTAESDLKDERDALAADADKWQRAALTLQGDRDALRAKLAHMTEARDHDWAEVERLAAQVDAVRAWIDRRGVNVDDRDDEYMRGYRDAQRHARLDALELRRALDGETDRD